MIIRTWIERGSPEPLRAQLRFSTDVSSGFDNTLTLTRAQDVCAAIQMWLEDVLRDAHR